MGLDARRDAGFPRSCRRTCCKDGKPSPTKQTGPFCKPQENAWQIGNLLVGVPKFPKRPHSPRSPPISCAESCSHADQ